MMKQSRLFHIQASDTFEKLKENVDKGYFEQLIQTYLLDNDHSSLLILAPEKGLTEKTEAETEEKLAAYKAGLSETELEAMVRQTKDLKRYQEEPSPAEDLAKIPILEIKDIEPKPQPFYNQHKEIQGFRCSAMMWRAAGSPMSNGYLIQAVCLLKRYRISAFYLRFSAMWIRKSTIIRSWPMKLTFIPAEYG